MQVKVFSSHFKPRLLSQKSLSTLQLPSIWIAYIFIKYNLEYFQTKANFVKIKVNKYVPQNCKFSFQTVPDEQLINIYNL